MKLKQHVLKKRIILDQIGSNGIKSDQIGLNFEKAILRKHVLKNCVLKEHGLYETLS